MTCASFIWNPHFGDPLPLVCFHHSEMTIPAALHTFVVLAKSATGAACADLIKQATSANGVYTFTPLLEAENVQKVQSPHILLQ
jgi:hypothetical protein